MPLYEMLHRIRRIQLQSDIVTACAGLFSFPRIENRKFFSTVPSHLPSNDVIIDVIKNVKEEVVTEMRDFQINMEKIEFHCQVKAVYEDNDEDDDDDNESEDDEEERDEDDFELDRLNESLNESDHDDVPDDILQERNELSSMWSTINLKDYSEKYPDINESSPFVTLVNGTGKEIVIRKSSLCWMMSTNKSTSSSDRLQRVKEDEWRTESSCKC